MTYEQTIAFLFEQLPMYQRTGAVAYKNNLDNTLELDDMFNHPHRQFKSIHVAGTNGKGSVSHSLASVLQCSGYKVGLYTSPHLRDYRERIRVNGEMISKEAVSQFVTRFFELNRNESLSPSFFEFSVMMAFDYFANQKVDVAVIEVGLGGRLDSTNIINPEISVITNIGFDHMNLLGDTLDKIAAEKAGIIKANVPVIIGEKQVVTESVFINKAKELSAPILFADQDYDLKSIENGIFEVKYKDSILYHRIEPGLKGWYQQKNLLTVIASIEELIKLEFDIPKRAVEDGILKVMENTGLEGRWQQLGINPKIVCDSGHNEEGLRWVVAQLKNEVFENLHVVFGTVNDKDVNKILALLPQDAIYYFAAAQIPRAKDAVELKEQAANFKLNGSAYSSVEEAVNAAKKNAGNNDMIFIGGSTFVVAEAI